MDELEIRKEVSQLQEMYKTQTSERLISALVLGHSGSGKTRLIETCRRPIHVDSFDPNGTETIRRGINEGWIIADTRYEREDPTNPTAFELWDMEFEKRRNTNYFHHFGTYALDSLSMFSEAVMNIVLKGLVRKADRGVKTAPIKTDLLRIPQENDYPLQMNIIKNVLTAILTLPCDIIVTGHLEDKKNKQGQVISRGLYTTGKLAIRIPRMFEEIYHMRVEEGARGMIYTLYTQPYEGIEARTRFGRDVFALREEPDIMALLTKAGLNPQHKEIPWLRKEE